VFRTVQATVTSTASVTRTVGKVLTAPVAAIGTVVKQITVRITAVVSATVSAVVSFLSSTPIGRIESKDTSHDLDGTAFLSSVESGTEDAIDVQEHVTTMVGSID
jgi:hypothetical protein